MSQELNRTLGFWSCLAVGVGLVVASTTLVSLGQGMGLAGGGFLYAMILAWSLQFFSAMSFAELACMMPRAGSLSSYTLVAMGPLPAIVSVLCGYVIVTILVGPAELTISGTVFSTTFAPDVSPLVFALVQLVALTGLNILGVDIFAKGQILFTAIMIVFLSFLGIAGLTGLGNPAPEMAAVPFNPMGAEVFSLAALAIWLYIGIEFVCPMVEETINFEWNIPWAMFTGLAIIFVVNVLYGFASIKYVPLEKLAESASPHVEVALAMFGRTGEIAIAIVSLAATASTLNTLIGVIPRMLYGMAHSGEAPAFFKIVHPTYRTPYVGIICISLSMLAVLVSGLAGIETIVIYIMAAAFSWLLAYIIAHLDVIILRVRQGGVARPYKSQLFPVPQVLGIVGMGYMMFNIFPDPVTKAEIFKYAFYFIGAAVVYAVVWIKLVMGRGLFETRSIQEAMSE